MKKKILFILPLLFANAIYSQVLYNETFDTFTVGNLGTDTTGGYPGKAGGLQNRIIPSQILCLQ